MSISYKSCFVSYCTNTTVTTPCIKFVTVPVLEERRKLWFEAARKKYKQTTTSFFCCEDHFDLESDMENYIKHSMMGGKIVLKASVVPHIFNWPESSPIKKLKLDVSVVPNKPVLSEYSHNYNAGTQTSCRMIDKYQQTSPVEVKSVAASCKLTSRNSFKLDTANPTITNEATTSPIKIEFVKVEDITSEMEVKQEPDDLFIEEQKIDNTEHVLSNDIFKEYWNSDKDDIQISNVIKQETGIDQSTNCSLQTCIIPKSESN